MIRKPVEHYVVKPNQTQGDWTYEYSNGSKVSDCDCCKMDTKRLSISIDNLKTSLLALQLSMQNMSMGGSMNQEQLNQAVEDVVNQYMQDSTVLHTVVDQAITNNADINNIKQQLRSINIQQLTNLGTQFNNLNTQFTELNGLVNTVNTNLSDVENRLNSHIDNISMHVLPSERERWNSNNFGPSPVMLFTYNEQTKTLNIITA